MKATMLLAVPPGMQAVSATPMARPRSRPQYLQGHGGVPVNVLMRVHVHVHAHLHMCIC